MTDLAIFVAALEDEIADLQILSRVAGREAHQAVDHVECGYGAGDFGAEEKVTRAPRPTSKPASR